MICTLESDGLDLHLLSPIYSKLHSDGTLDDSVTLGIDIDTDITEALLLIISLDDIT